jgi:hypothetical protein
MLFQRRKFPTGGFAFLKWEKGVCNTPASPAEKKVVKVVGVVLSVFFFFF